MSLHPIVALNHVIDEYREYLLSEFRAKDPGLKLALERELDQPLFLAQEPFFQAHRPFLHGKRWRDLPIDARLARVMEARSQDENSYIHQSLAIERLLSTDAGPVVVTTGTGSGKTEAFLLPVIQNAIEDSVRFNRPGLTAILVYPMNALSNDQARRIEQYLGESGFSGSVTVAQYDRGTSEQKRNELRTNPPHILLTNYMMLEYLLVRPADRDGIFANHRCRFLVLDEVHTYRGTLGSNIAFLVRRLRAHLGRAKQTWGLDVADSDRARRFPTMVPIGTSATIKSLVEQGLSREEMIRLRDEAVQEFFSKITGVEPTSIRVLGEELESITVPEESTYSPTPTLVEPNLSDRESVAHGLAQLAGAPVDLTEAEAAGQCRLLWDLNRWLISAPMSASQIVARIMADVPERRGADHAIVHKEVEAALLLGAGLPDAVPSALRLRVHRFIRGGWHFYRCVDPQCGRVYPMGEEHCTCGRVTAPLYLCRNCGADYLRFVGDPDTAPLRPSGILGDGPEWMLYDPQKFDLQVDDEDDEDDEDNRPVRGNRQAFAQIRRRPVLAGSFDPATLAFSRNPNDYSLRATLAPARTRCLCCGGTAGSRNVITPVALGTSAAVKVLAEGLVEALDEANQGRDGHDGKERLLVFSDSRQDAAHQARFIIFASRYDRMRRNVMRILADQGPLPFQRVVELLGNIGVRDRDNPNVPEDDIEWMSQEQLQRIRAWEEAPLLDEVALTAGYRATLVNLGLVEIRYEQLNQYVDTQGVRLAEGLGVRPGQLAHVCRCLLDEMRRLGAVSREMLRYHPSHQACPAYIKAADWERRVKSPRGFATDANGRPLPYNTTNIPAGVTCRNSWRRPGVGGRSPGLERILKELLNRFGGVAVDVHHIVDVLDFLRRGQYLVASELYGFRQHIRLLQVNAERITIAAATNSTRMRCEVCGSPFAGSQRGLPCPRCHGALVPWTEDVIEQNRTVKRIKADTIVPLVAGEHTAQVTNEVRVELERKFKASATESKLNLLACSPTLEMGIDVGGLEAVVLRNVPPRPDNYAQRGGRAGRRLRIGMVVGYARSTPHDEYFYDHPEQMIAGEVPAPVLALGNRDVLLRHINAIAFSSADPGLAGRMFEYVGAGGEVKQDTVDKLIAAVSAQRDYTIAMSREAFSDAVLEEAQLDDPALREEMSRLGSRIQDVVDRTARQVRELRRALEAYAADLLGASAANRSAQLVARLLGIQTERTRDRIEADDRSAGYPLRRFAEFGILPGYEFPTEPATVRLLGDPHEEDPVSIARRIGIGQFQPGAQVYARAKRWKVTGLDTASPWNPRTDGPGLLYRVCRECELRYTADAPTCARCGVAQPGAPIRAEEFAGFLARRDENTILDEEDRFATRNLVKGFPQWNGTISGRWQVAGGWVLRLNRREEIYWINEGIAPSPEDIRRGAPILHANASGYLLCSSCGRILSPRQPGQGGNGRRAPRAGNAQDPFGHAEQCPHRGTAPSAVALATVNTGEVLRLQVSVPAAIDLADLMRWGMSLGYSVLTGMRRVYMLDGTEIEFVLEGPWRVRQDDPNLNYVALSFVDPSVGGTGYLRKVAEQFHAVSAAAIEHLDHRGCETACYRCLKTYQNQRFHEFLNWTSAMGSLETLASTPVSEIPLQVSDLDDPGPWLEAYSAGVGSPLELKFMRLFEQHGFHPEKQVAVSPEEGAPPISIADFAVPGSHLAIYIDGASFHVGDRLRRDRIIRTRLRNGNPPWTVEEFRAADLRLGGALVERLKSLAKTQTTSGHLL
jgi:hypothetical protein